MNYKKQFQKQLRKILIKAQGTTEPVPCEYELNEEELICRSTGMESKIAWSTVTECKVTDMGIEVIMKPAFLLFIPKRLFKNAGEIEEWAGFIEKRMKSKKSPASNDSPPTSLGNSRVNEGPPSVS